MSNFKYAAINEAVVYDSVQGNKGKKPVNKILMGTYVKILETDGDWSKVSTAGPDGWMHKDSLTDNMGLKIFFLDVGQGDGILIEIGKYKILIDAGPDNCMYSYLTKWQYKYLLDANQKVHIDFLIVSHFDSDHYKGFTRILNNKGFTVGTVVHAGILKLASKDNPFNTDLGNMIRQNGQSYLTQVFDDLLSPGANFTFNRDITNFLEELNAAHQEGRIGRTRRCAAGDVLLDEQVESKPLKLEVLAPFLETVGGNPAFMYWNDEGVTINGNSLVLKLTFGSRSMLLGGDLNSVSQLYLLSKYPHSNPFEVDVAKSCHHGSSDFSEAFMGKVNPYATVISSGDNEGHAHPRADAIGCAGKYSKSKRPLVYSTELARSVDLRKNDILFGMINLRCNGQDIFMSQMKEVKKPSDIWDAYEVK